MKSRVSLRNWNIGGPSSTGVTVYNMFHISTKFDGYLSNWTITNPASMSNMLRCGNPEFTGSFISSWTVTSPAQISYPMSSFIRDLYSLGLNQHIDISQTFSNRFGTENIGKLGAGASMVWTDISYWAVDEFDNTIIVASFHSTYYSYIKITFNGTFVTDSGKYEYTAASGQNNGVAPSAYTYQSQLVSDYNGATDVVGSPRDFQKGANFYNTPKKNYKIKIFGSPHQGGYTQKYLIIANIKLQNINTGEYITLYNPTASSYSGSNYPNRASNNNLGNYWHSANGNNNGSLIDSIWWKADVTLDSHASYRIYITGRGAGDSNESSPVIVQLWDNDETTISRQSPILAHSTTSSSQVTVQWDFFSPKGGTGGSWDYTYCRDLGYAFYRCGCLGINQQSSFKMDGCNFANLTVQNSMRETFFQSFGNANYKNGNSYPNLDSFGDIGGSWIASNTERFPVDFYAYDVETYSYIVGIVHYTADGRLKMCRITSDGKNLGGAKYYIGGADINNPNPVPTSQKDIISKYNEGTVADNGGGYNFNIGRGFVVLGYKLSTENIGVVDGDYVNPPGLTYWAFCDDSNIIVALKDNNGNIKM